VGLAFLVWCLEDTTTLGSAIHIYA
jgi:hypothetical protein